MNIIMITASIKGTPEGVANAKCRREKFLSDAYRQRVEKMLYDMSAERKMPRIVYQMIEANAQSLFDEKMLGEAVIVCQRVYAMIKE